MVVVGAGRGLASRDLTGGLPTLIVVSTQHQLGTVLQRLSQMHGLDLLTSR